MLRNPYTRYFLILLIAALAIWVDLSDHLTVANPFTSRTIFKRNVSPRLGLDLRGGLQVLMEADLPPDTPVTAESMDVARTILENRTNALGVAENTLQVAGERRIVGEFPGVEDAEAVIAIIQKTGLLEFVDMGTQPVEAGTIIQTDFGITQGTEPTPIPGVSPEAGVSPTPETLTTATPETTLAPEAAPTNAPEAAPTQEAQIYHTVMTGKSLKSVVVQPTQLGGYEINFTLDDEGTKVFGEHTSTHVNQFLAIVLDKQVVSVPIIKSAITEGQGSISGGSTPFTAESANALAVQLRYGSLPVPLKIVETRIIGPTLGEDSLRKSLVAGLVGMTIVMLFMAIYYRLPGFVADIAILFYAIVAYALFKYIPVTLTLAGIAGFLLSTGSALDANILIFERLKEELRGGMSLSTAVDRGWKRAWPSIRDSNIATLITSGILFWFGSTFGATIVKGFSFTLALGVAISLLTAIYVTRTILALTLKLFKPTNLTRWFGL